MSDGHRDNTTEEHLIAAYGQDADGARTELTDTGEPDAGDSDADNSNADNTDADVTATDAADADTADSTAIDVPGAPAGGSPAAFGAFEAADIDAFVTDHVRLGRRLRRRRVAQQVINTASSVTSALRSNVVLAGSAILTVAVALTMSGLAIAVADGVSNATMRWQGGIESIVFMDPDATEAEIDAVGDVIAQNPLVRDLTYITQEEAHREFTAMFADSPELLRSVGPDALPSSWRVVPQDGVSHDQVAELGDRLTTFDGVYQVVYARDAVQGVRDLSGVIEAVLATTAGVLAGAALLMTIASCRASAWSRREELAVMRLVGAPRWLTRLPFLIENVLYGAVGGMVAGFVTWELSDVIEDRVTRSDTLTLLSAFDIDNSTRGRIVVLLVLIGAFIGLVGATIGAQRYVTAGEGLPAGLVRRSLWRTWRTLRRVARRTLRRPTALLPDQPLVAESSGAVGDMGDEIDAAVPATLDQVEPPALDTTRSGDITRDDDSDSQTDGVPRGAAHDAPHGAGEQEAGTTTIDDSSPTGPGKGAVSQQRASVLQ